jgi:hypothetical protein
MGEHAGADASRAIDEVLVRAWKLAFRDSSEEGRAELESLLPRLIAAGYVETDERVWNFSPSAVARVDALLPDD